jgi:hydrogenase maturation factor
MESLAPQCDHTSGCITCGDEALPLRVLRIDADRGLALCANAAGESSTVETALVEPVALDEILLVHAGTAIGRNAEAVQR